MIKIKFDLFYKSCPYGFRVETVKIHSPIKEDVIGVGSQFCSECKYYVKRVKLECEGYVLCKYSNFENKLKVVKNLLD